MSLRTVGSGMSLLLLLSCRNETGPLDLVTTSVARTDYSAPANVVFTVHNRSGGTARITACDGRIAPVVDTAHAGTWVHTYSQDCGAATLTDVFVAPGADVTD